MRLTLRATPNRLADRRVERLILRDLTAALRSISNRIADTGRPKLVVNPVVWRKPSDGKMNPLVANQAAFFSESFQASLCANGVWEREKLLEGQRLDAYAEFECESGDAISANDLYQWLPMCTEPSRQIPAIFARNFGSFVERAIFRADDLPKMLKLRSTRKPGGATVRVGVEFETGNIASSFRALLKLGLLFRLGKIDVGVFVTSNNKALAAAAIWPPSNRNGSFEELESRRWREVLDFPVLGIGFEPDGFDLSEAVLRRDGYHLRPVPQNKFLKVGAKQYEEWRLPGEKSYWYVEVK